MSRKQPRIDVARTPSRGRIDQSLEKFIREHHATGVVAPVGQNATANPPTSRRPKSLNPEKPKISVPGFERTVHLHPQFKEISQLALAELAIIQAEDARIINATPAITLLGSGMMRRATRNQVDSGILEFGTIVEETLANAPDSFAAPLTLTTTDTNFRFGINQISKDKSSIYLSIANTDQLAEERQFLADQLRKFSGREIPTNSESRIGLFAIQGSATLGDRGESLADFLLDGQQIAIDPVEVRYRSLD